MSTENTSVTGSPPQRVIYALVETGAPERRPVDDSDKSAGGVTQTFGSLHNWCVSAKVLIDDECILTGNDPTRAVLDRTDVVSSEPWTKIWHFCCDEDATS